MKTLLLLGSGSDIAKAIARKFAREGYTIQLAGRKEEQMKRLQQDLSSRWQAEVSIHHFDATDFASHPAFIAHLPLLPDVVVYAAGAMAEQADAESDWLLSKNMIEVNYTGPVSVFNRIVPLMKERGSGYLIGLSSVAGDRGRGSNYIYGSTKAAFTAYLSGLRNQMCKKNVRVITVKPGFVYTKMTQHLDLPKILTAKPESVADQIYNAIRKNKNILYIKPVWRWIMMMIKLLPEAVFKKTNL